MFNFAILGQNAAYLIIRGMKTLHLRVQQQNTTAQRMAEILEAHPKVINCLKNSSSLKVTNFFFMFILFYFFFSQIGTYELILIVTFSSFFLGILGSSCIIILVKKRDFRSICFCGTYCLYFFYICIKTYGYTC